MLEIQRRSEAFSLKYSDNVIPSSLFPIKYEAVKYKV